MTSLSTIRHAARRWVWSALGIEAKLESAIRLPVGQISLAEARFLGTMIAALQSRGPIVEIGTLFGWSTRVMVLYKEPWRELITVDDFSWNPLGLSPDAHARCTLATLEEAIRELNVRVVRQHKSDFYRSYHGATPSLVFLDAVHSYEETKKDIDWARQVNARIVCVHDYASEHPGVVRAVDEAGGPKDLVQTLALV